MILLCFKPIRHQGCILQFPLPSLNGFHQKNVENSFSSGAILNFLSPLPLLPGREGARLPPGAGFSLTNINFVSPELPHISYIVWSVVSAACSYPAPPTTVQHLQRARAALRSTIISCYVTFGALWIEYKIRMIDIGINLALYARQFLKRDLEQILRSILNYYIRNDLLCVCTANSVVI